MRENVKEIWNSVARRNLFQKATFIEIVCFKSEDIKIIRNLAHAVDVHIQEHCCEQFCHIKTYAVIAGCNIFLHQFHWNNFTGDVVFSIYLKHFWGKSPMLI